jgi:hypothetical protein
MIFAFGLPGYRSNRQATPCILAGRKVLEIMKVAGVRGTAGITTGMCFCGLVGDPRIRCEYAVMGGTVTFPFHAPLSPVWNVSTPFRQVTDGTNICVGVVGV